MGSKKQKKNRTSYGSNVIIEECKVGKSRAWLYVVLMVILLVAVAGGVFAVLKYVNPEGFGGGVVGDNGDAANSDEGGSRTDNETLAAGTVTMEIDGKKVTYRGAYVVDGINAEITSGTYQSLNDDEVVFLVINGGSLRVQGEVSIMKMGTEEFDGRGDDYSFYGTNSAIAVVGEGSSVSLEGVMMNTEASGANGVVAVNGGEAVIKQTSITTQKDNSRGLHATFGGSINADNVVIITQGASSASLATDRGEGTVVASNMDLSTAGAGSPLFYSTGAITVSNSRGAASGAQIAVIEGKNSLDMQGCDFSAYGMGVRNGVDNAGVMIYQSMSGDAKEGTGTLTVTDSRLTLPTESAVYMDTPLFFVTNTDATINVTGSYLTFSPDAKLVVAKGTSEWGASGANGGKVNVSLVETTATNTNVEADAISSVGGL